MAAIFEQMREDSRADEELTPDDVHPPGRDPFSQAGGVNDLRWRRWRKRQHDLGRDREVRRLR